MDGKTMYLRLTQKWTSKDSFDFKDEGGPATDSMTVMTEGKGTRVTRYVATLLRNSTSSRVGLLSLAKPDDCGPSFCRPGVNDRP
jgi:hypothetical protein